MLNTRRLLAAALLTLLPACGPVPVPPAPHPPPIVTPAVYTVDFVACKTPPYQRLGDGSWACFSPLVTATVNVNTQPGDHFQVVNQDGYTVFTLPDSNASVFLTAPEYLPWDLGHTVRIKDIPAHNVIQLLPDFVPLPRLVARGHVFGLATGAHFTVIEASDFNLYARFLAGEDIEPILAQRAGAGFNCLRVWTYYDLTAPPPIGRLIPAEHADFYTRLPDFLHAAARHGLYVELTAYVGPETSDPSHWTKLIDAVRAETSVIVELVNENDIHPIDLTPFARPVGVLASHGSNGADSPPVKPDWDYALYHTNGIFEWWRKTGHNAMEQSDGPVVANENTRYLDTDASLTHAFDAAAGAALLAAGSCFHSQSGKPSVLWAGLELDAAKAWAAGARSVPLACQDGLYTHRADLETPGLLRVYERPVAGVDCIVRIRQ